MLVRNKTVFGSKLKKRKFKNTTPVRDKDITHFTAYVLQKYTRVIRRKKISPQILVFLTGHGMGNEVYFFQVRRKSQSW